MKHKFILFLLLFIGIVKCIAGNAIITYSQSSTKIKLGNKAHIISDPEHLFTLSQILSDSSKSTYTDATPNLGLSNNTYWATFDLVNLSDDKLILKFNQPLLNEVTLYRIQGGNVSKKTYSESNPFGERKYYYSSFAFDLDAKLKDTITYVLKFNSNEPIFFDVVIAKDATIAKEELQHEVINGIFIGILFVMIFYNLFIYFTVLDISYLAYVCYIIFIGITHNIAIPGYGFMYIWPNYPEFNDLSVILFSVLAAIAAIEFFKIFLKTRVHVPGLHNIFLILEITFLSILVIYFTGNKIMAFTMVQVVTFILSVFIIIVACKIIYIGYRPAVFFLIAWITLLASACLYIAKDFGILPHNLFTTHAMQIGTSVEVILLSFALADRINILKKEKEQSQVQALSALLQNELIIKNQNIILEKKVEERTKELKNANQELSTTIADLKQTQTQLLTSEKMASLGHLTAGIAHEINNPINFVVSNVRPLKKDIEDIYELIQKYETIDPLSSLQNKISEINSFKDEIDYAYLKQEIGSLLKGIEDGAEKTAGIVQGLNVYSRVDENDFKRANILEGISSSLTLLNTDITSASIELIKNFSPIPQIECFPGKLNQVFMNILNNAIYAIKDNRQRAEKGQLIITIHADNYNIYISFKDNGTGMTEEVKAKVFEPFFSTKDAGKGAGLGMSIAYSIINEHNGSIQLNTTYAKGSEFIITLPINYTKK